MKEYVTAQDISIGKQIEPLKRVYLFSSEEYEAFIKEWLDIKEGYLSIEKLGGAGDMGRDVVAYIDDPKTNPDNYRWDCYQCKHYDKALTPTNSYIELAKIIYYTFKKEYPVPQKYFFVAPKGVGTTLSSLLNKPSKLKENLKEKWGNYCESQITKSQNILLQGNLLKYFNEFDFTIFSKISQKIVIEEYKKHPNHLVKFGGGLPTRTISENIPSPSVDEKLRYVNQLTLAYNSDSKDKNITQISDIQANSRYNGHFERARKSFYQAEELRNFTRDNCGLTVFNDFQEEIYESIINIAEENFRNGFKKVQAVEDKATGTPIESNPLREQCRNLDKKGVCHQLVNEEKISWVEDEE